MNYIFSSVAGDSLTLYSTLAILGSALIMGLLISLVYIYTHKESGYASSFATTLIMLPAIIATIILLVGSNVARAYSLARSLFSGTVPKRPRRPEGCSLCILHRSGGTCLRHGSLLNLRPSLRLDSLPGHDRYWKNPISEIRKTSPHDLKDRDPGGSEL